MFLGGWLSFNGEMGKGGWGRTFAYTSDPAPHWGCNFVFWEEYATFWTNVCDWLVDAKI